GLNRLVIDLRCLQSVNLLNLIHEVGLYGIRSENIQYFFRRNRSIGKLLAGFHIVVLLNKNMLGQRNKIGLLGLAIFTFNNYFLFPALTPAKSDDTINFRYRSRITW